MILLIEDAKTISDTLSDYLTTEGFHVESASCKVDALVAISKTTYELLIIDVSLPDGNGFEICKMTSKIGNARYFPYRLRR